MNESAALAQFAPLIYKEARRYAWMGGGWRADMLQEGRLAVVKAARLCGPGRPMYPLAEACIRNRLANYARTQIRRRQVGEMRNSSMDAEIDENGHTYHDVFGQSFSAADRLTMTEIWDIVDRLPVRMKGALYAIYRDGLTYREAGARLGLSGARVKQIELDALAKVRVALNNKRLSG